MRPPRPLRPGSRRAALVLAGLLAFAPGADADEAAASGTTPTGRTTFRAYGVERGLGDFLILTLYQDRRGFLWAGTEDGLFRYDGREFERFGRTEGLPSTYVGAMCEGADGTLWAGTFSGLARWADGAFVPVAGGAGLPAEPVRDLQGTPDGRLWVGQRSGLYFGTSARGFFPAPGWPGGDASALAVDGQGRLWAAASPAAEGGRTRVLTLSDSGWREWPLPGLAGERLTAPAGDGAGRVWARSSTQLFVLDPGADAFRQARPPARVESQLGRLAVDRDGRILVPTETGLLVLYEDGWHLVGRDQGLPTGWAQVALVDREGSLWIGSTGLHRQLGGGVWHGCTTVDGLPSDVVRALFRSADGTLWVGTEKGLARAAASRFELLAGTERNGIRTIQEDRAGSLYLAGVPVEVLRVDPRRGRIERFGAESGLRGTRVLRMVLDPSGTLWVAADGGGLRAARTGPGPLRFEPVVVPGGSETEYFSGLILDGEGRLWAAGEKGLAVRDGGTWTRFTNADGLRETHVAYALSLRSGELVVAYFEGAGLSRVTYDGGRISVADLLAPGSVLATQKVFMLGEDRSGRIWAGTGLGVTSVENGAERRYRAEDGLVGEDFNNMTFLEDADGSLWFGTMSGLARFDPRVTPPSVPPPATAILETKLGPRSWKGPAPDGERLVYRENVLEVRYAGLSFVRENAVESETRLVGLEPEWRASRIRELRISALPPGEYRFEVRSRAAAGEWGPVAGFSFSIAPAWWQSLWFRALALLALAGLVALAVQRRLRKLHRRTVILETLVDERTRELKAANEALRNQSLTDPLTGLRNRRYLGVSVPEVVAQVNRNHRNVALGRGDRATVNVDLVFLMVDVDHFKSVNDAHGHHAGDEVLRQLAAVLRSATRESDTVVRWGGEEFLVVGRNTCRKECAVLAERIRARVAAHEFRLDDGTVLRRTCSVGFASYPVVGSTPDHVEWEQVVDLADQALYAAKLGGRNAWVGLVARDDLGADAITRSPAQELAALVERGDFEVRTSLPDASSLSWKAHKD